MLAKKLKRAQVVAMAVKFRFIQYRYKQLQDHFEASYREYSFRSGVGGKLERRKSYLAT